MVIHSGKPEKFGEKPAPLPLYPPQISHKVMWNWTQESVVRSWHVITWAMVWPMLPMINLPVWYWEQLTAWRIWGFHNCGYEQLCLPRCNAVQSIGRHLMFWKNVLPQSTLLADSFTLVSCVAYSSVQKMEAACSSTTSIDFQWSTRCYTLGDKSHQLTLCCSGLHIGTELWNK
jgi:hypothetical protein